MSRSEFDVLHKGYLDGDDALAMELTESIRFTRNTVGLLLP
jgi:hypothetical protein